MYICIFGQCSCIFGQCICIFGQFICIFGQCICIFGQFFCILGQCICIFDDGVEFLPTMLRFFSYSCTLADVVAYLSMLSHFCKFTVLWASVVVFLKFHILSCDAIKCLTYSSSSVRQAHLIELCMVYNFGQNISNKKRQFNYMREGNVLGWQERKQDGKKPNSFEMFLSDPGPIIVYPSQWLTN